MRKTFAVLAALLLLVVVAQFAAAATGAFSTRPRDVAFAAHFALGWVVFGLPLLMALVGALARVPGRLVALSVLVAALASLQVGIARLAAALGAATTAGQLTFALHGLTALAILGLAATLLRGSGTAGAARPR